MCHGRFGSLGHQVSLELRKHCQHTKYHLSRSAGRIDPFAQAHEIGAASGKSLANGDGVRGRSGESEQRIDDEDRLLLAGLGEGRLQCRAVIGSTARQPSIYMDGA